MYNNSFAGFLCSFYLYQVAMTKKNLDDSDVFILDTGRKIYQWNGSTANKDERFTVSSVISTS